MSDITAIAGKVAGIVSLVAFIPYILAILRGETKPNWTTWWIWTVIGLMLGASYYYSGANHTIWVPVSYIVGPFVTTVLSIKYGEGGWTRFDRCCLLGAGVSVALWWMLSSSLVALLINLFIDFMGALPTIRKAYHEPESEDRTAWALFFAGSTANLFAVETLNKIMATSRTSGHRRPLRKRAERFCAMFTHHLKFSSRFSRINFLFSDNASFNYLRLNFHQN